MIKNVVVKTEPFVIYLITNKINGKQYIGMTTRTIEERWYDHCRMADYYNTYLQRAIRKYGSQNFKIEIVDTCFDFEELNLKEQHYIKTCNTMAPNGYNLTTGGNQYRFTDEHKRYLSKIRQGTQKGSKNYFY